MVVVKNPHANAGDIIGTCLIPGLGRPPRGGHGNPLHYSWLENPMDREIWQAIVYGVTRVTHYLATKPPCIEDPYMLGAKGCKDGHSSSLQTSRSLVGWKYITYTKC